MLHVIIFYENPTIIWFAVIKPFHKQKTKTTSLKLRFCLHTAAE